MPAKFILRDWCLVDTSTTPHRECPQNVYDRIVARIADQEPGVEFNAADLARQARGADIDTAAIVLAFLYERDLIEPAPGGDGGYRTKTADVQGDAIAAFWALDGA